MNRNNSEKNSTKVPFNVADVLILLFAALLFVSLITRIEKLFVFKTVENQEEYRVLFSVNDISSRSEAYFVTDDTVIIADDGVQLGKLEKINEVVPHKLYVKNDQNEIVTVNYPSDTRVDLSGTLISIGVMTDEGYKLKNGRYLATGDSFLVYTEHVSFVLTVLDITQK